MRYRAEIDGLRAVAVTPVILFHAGFPGFAGGFVGVDVFFVISGFLIAAILYDEFESGRFSLMGFYERRARRILPVLFFVMAATVPAAWWLLSPKDLQDYAQSLVAISLFASNMLFWQESGYFDTAAELKPMLHTWSLAVEEQYYVVFPLLLIAAWRLGPGRLLALLAVIAAASLALSEWLTRTQPITAFFLAPSRAWQMLLGAMIALGTVGGVERLGPSRAGRLAVEALAVLGLALIAWSMVAYDKHTPFPGLNALAPTVGTGLIIAFATRGTAVGRLLALPAFVGIGLISYSAYLWHQPVFAFARHAALDEVSPWLMAALSLATFALAYLSWRFVEQPFRNRAMMGRRTIFAFSAAGIVAFAGIGLTGHLTADSLTHIRLADVDPALKASFRDKDALVAARRDAYRPYVKAAQAPFDADLRSSRVLILGDSVANDLYGALSMASERFPDAQFRRLPLDDLCMPQFERGLRGDFSGPPDTGDAGRDCLAETRRLLDSPLFAEADVLVLNAFWRRRSTETPHVGALALAETLAAQGREVAVVGLMAMKDASSTAFLALREGMSWAEANALAYRTLQRRAIEGANAEAAALATRLHGVTYLDKRALFCSDDEQRCLLYDAAGDLMFSDGHHLSAEGAQWLGGKLADIGWPAATTMRRGVPIHEVGGDL